jgi:general secretion pathway protein A
VGLLLPDYLKYWGFTGHPFSLAPDPEMLYFSTQHREGLLRLKYAVYSNKGGALLISDHPGDGKTSLLLRLIADLKQESGGKVMIAFLDHPTLTAPQMIREITRQLTSGKGSRDKISNLNLLREHLSKLQEEGYKTVAVLDEGQMLAQRPDLLQELRILLNLCKQDSFLLTLIFSGQKPLEGAIRRMPEFWQRLPVRFFLGNLSLADTKGLIKYRLQKSGLEGKDIFTETAYEGIYRFSQGCPRVICTVADLALLIGYTTYAQKIDFVQVSQACADMGKTGEADHYYCYLRSKDQERPRSRRAEGENGYLEKFDQNNYTLKRDFILGLNKITRGNLLKKITYIKRKYGLEGSDKPFFVLPKGNIFKDSVLLEIRDNGQNISSSKAGLALSDSGIHLILKKEIKTIPYGEIRSCRAQRQWGKNRFSYQIRIEGEDLSCQLSFPCFKQEAKAFALLLENYIKAKCHL